MKAVRLHDAMDLRVEEVERPGAPPAGFVTLDVRAAGICGSDLHNYRTGQWISRRPSTAGHEFCGRVTAVGEGVGDLSVGDLVARVLPAGEPAEEAEHHLARVGPHLLDRQQPARHRQRARRPGSAHLAARSARADGLARRCRRPTTAPALRRAWPAIAAATRYSPAPAA